MKNISPPGFRYRSPAPDISAGENHSTDPVTQATEFLRAVAVPDGPGIAVGVYRDSTLEFFYCSGLVEIGANERILMSTRFRVGCLAMQFNAFIVRRLVERGVGSVDTDIREVLRELPSSVPRVTLGQILNHTSGIADFRSLMALTGRDYFTETPETAYAAFCSTPLFAFAPGTAYGFSRSADLIVRLLIERLKGRPYADVCRDEVFTPLGLTATAIGAVRADGIPTVAAGHSIVNGQIATTQPNDAWTPMVSNVIDLGRWSTRQREPRWAGSGKLLALSDPSRNAWLGYADGEHVKRVDDRLVHLHSGHSPGFDCGVCRFPDHNLSVVALSNAGWIGSLSTALSVAELFLQGRLTHRPSREKPVRDDRQPPPLIDVDGEYYCPELDTTYRLTLTTGAVDCACRGNTVRLTHVVDRTFRGDWQGTDISIHFGDGPGRVDEFLAVADGAPQFRFTRKVSRPTLAGTPNRSPAVHSEVHDGI